MTYLIGVQHPATIGWLLLIVAAVAAIDGALAQRRQHTDKQPESQPSTHPHH